MHRPAAAVAEAAGTRRATSRDAVWRGLSIFQDRMRQCLELADNRLADKRLEGDRRVNWLIARARAEEMRFGARDPHQIGIERLGTGQDWLQEAELAAVARPLQSRAASPYVFRTVTSAPPLGASRSPISPESGSVTICIPHRLLRTAAGSLTQ